ncbi:Hypothetical predicted protein [Olea europaea subsp. europaea]|uniref:Uncharacterized protein n=1 Tax=Olea europaea subsp. europaea TaxID=158383 RepID=A0A8S0TQL2_OLEEU|nr:Hypothetical predicted protein [Olea europaea subsp. europaea]
MTSPKVMASISTPNADLLHHTSSSSLSVTTGFMEETSKNIYYDFDLFIVKNNTVEVGMPLYMDDGNAGGGIRYGSKGGDGKNLPELCG